MEIWFYLNKILDKKEYREIDLNQGCPDHQTETLKSMATGDIFSWIQDLIN